MAEAKRLRPEVGAPGIVSVGPAELGPTLRTITSLTRGSSGSEGFLFERRRSNSATLIAVSNAGKSWGEPRGERLRPSQRKVLEALSWSTTLTRAALAEQLGAPKATLAGLVDSLIEGGLVVESKAPADLRRPGRPAKVLMLAGPRPRVGALVFSGGMLTAAVLTYAGDVLGRASVPVGGWAHDEVV